MSSGGCEDDGDFSIQNLTMVQPPAVLLQTNLPNMIFMRLVHVVHKEVSQMIRLIVHFCLGVLFNLHFNYSSINGLNY